MEEAKSRNIITLSKCNKMKIQLGKFRHDLLLFLNKKENSSRKKRSSEKRSKRHYADQTRWKTFVGSALTYENIFVFHFFFFFWSQRTWDLANLQR